MQGLLASACDGTSRKVHESRRIIMGSISTIIGIFELYKLLEPLLSSLS